VGIPAKRLNRDQGACTRTEFAGSKPVNCRHEKHAEIGAGPGSYIRQPHDQRLAVIRSYNLW
jgi:hypothetical protein